MSLDAADLQALADALALHQARDFPGAIVLYRGLVERHPTEIALVKGLAVALMDHGDYEGAGRQLQRLVSRGLIDPETLILHGQALLAVGRTDAALSRFDTALSLAPDRVGALRGRATALANTDGAAEAVGAWRDLLAHVPAEPGSWSALSLAAEAAGDGATARAALRRMLALAPEPRPLAAVRLARLGAAGGPPPDLPEGYVEAHFDNFAGGFDYQLVNQLRYAVPADMAAHLPALLPDTPWEVLDLGCGTGLVATALAARLAAIDGIDLSIRMIEKARARGLYRELIVGDVLAALARLPSGSTYHLATAADVLVYVADPAPWFAAVAPLLRPGGLFAFSIELDRDGDVSLNPHLRYRHGPALMTRLAASAGLETVLDQPIAVRRNNGIPVEGRLMAARRPA